MIYFFSFFVNILSYYGALQWVIMKMGWGIQKVMGTTVCESVNAAASIFLGMVCIIIEKKYFEAPNIFYFLDRVTVTFS